MRLARRGGGIDVLCWGGKEGLGLLGQEILMWMPARW